MCRAFRTFGTSATSSIFQLWLDGIRERERAKLLNFGGLRSLERARIEARIQLAEEMIDDLLRFDSL